LIRRLAVWSGPRNLSTALMRSFSSRGDCVVSDEPFYASYLATTAFDHPGRAEILDSQPQDWRDVAATLSTGPAPLTRPVWYQKQMAQHMREEMIDSWLDQLDHAFLVRHPARVIASYMKVFPSMTLAETGLPWQMRLFQWLRDVRGAPPMVIDAADLQRNPEATLRRLCVGFGLAWDPAMLAWPAGPHPQDGIWAAHWYANTWQSTGFVPITAEPPLPEPDVPFLADAVALYDQLRSCSNAATQPTIT